jgi:hypothetical protein
MTGDGNGTQEKLGAHGAAIQTLERGQSEMFRQLRQIAETLGDIRGDIKLLNYKSTAWGALGGAIISGMGFLIWLLQNSGK